MLSKWQVLNWRTDHLGSAAKTWDDQANRIESAAADAQRTIDVLSWTGIFSEWIREQLRKFVEECRPKIAKLRSAAKNARVGEQFEQKTKDNSIMSIQAAEKEDFTVNDDLSVKDNISENKREPARVAHETTIKAYAQQLETTDKAIADALHKIAEDLSGFHLDGPDGKTNFSGDPNPLGNEFGANRDLWNNLMMSPAVRELWQKLSARGSTIKIDSSIQGMGAYTAYDKNGVPYIRVSPDAAKDPETLQRLLLHELGNSKNILEGRIVSGREIADVEGRSRLFAIQCQEEILEHGGPNLREGDENNPNDEFTKIRALYNEASQSNDPNVYERAAQQAGRMWGETLLECNGVPKSVYDMYGEGVTCTANGWAK